MAAKSILVAASFIALACAAPQAFAGNSPNLAAAPTQQISPPSDGSDSNGQPTQRRHKHTHKKRQQQPAGTPQQGNGANPG